MKLITDNVNRNMQHSRNNMLVLCGGVAYFHEPFPKVTKMRFTVGGLINRNIRFNVNRELKI